MVKTTSPKADLTMTLNKGTAKKNILNIMRNVRIRYKMMKNKTTKQRHNEVTTLHHDKTYESRI